MTIRHEASSGNVYADIGISEPAKTLAKAELARRISSIIKHHHLKQTDAANVFLNID